jgi:hypothetical protein
MSRRIGYEVLPPLCGLAKVRGLLTIFQAAFVSS